MEDKCVSQTYAMMVNDLHSDIFVNKCTFVIIVCVGALQLFVVCSCENLD